MDYADLEIRLYRQDVNRYAVELRLSRPNDDADRAPVRGEARLSPEELLQVHGENTTTYGEQLYRDLFADPAVRGEWENAYNAGMGIRLRLSIDGSARELHNVRWETLRRLADHAWVLTSERILFSRFLVGTDPRPIQLRPRGELRALLVISAPADLKDPRSQFPAIDVAAEKQRVLEHLGGLAQVDELVSDAGSPGTVTLQKLGEKLHNRYDVVYLVCHGLFRPPSTLPAGAPADSNEREPVLLLEKNDGTTDWSPGRALVERLRDLVELPRLMVLVSCQSAGDGREPHTGDEGALAALGPRLAEIGVPAVLAMQGNVTVRTMQDFMPVFFAELGRDGQIDRAMAAARGAVRERMDSWMPALFMRLRLGRIWQSAQFSTIGSEDKPWPALTGSLRNLVCTPILGPGLTEYLLGSRRELAWRWAEEEGLPLAEQYRQDLQQVTQYLNTVLKSDYVQARFARYVHAEILRRHPDAVPEEMAKPPAVNPVPALGKLIAAVGATLRQQNEHDPFRLLAELPIPLYITANPDTLMEDALVEQHRRPVSEWCRWNKELESFPSIYDVEKEYRPDIDRPLVYHLLGTFAEPDSLVITEDDYFDFLAGTSKLQMQSPSLIPGVVSNAWSKNALLYLGFRLDDWIFRILFHSMMGEGRVIRKPPTSAAVQISPEEGPILQPERARRYLEKYLSESYNARITMYWGTAEDFVQELHANWLKDSGGGR